MSDDKQNERFELQTTTGEREAMTREELEDRLVTLSNWSMDVHNAETTIMDPDAELIHPILAEFDRLHSRLADIVSALPTTADGAAIVTGLQVWVDTGYDSDPWWIRSTVETLANGDPDIGLTGNSWYPTTLIRRRHPITGKTPEQHIGKEEK